MSDFFSPGSLKTFHTRDIQPYQVDSADANKVYMRYKSGSGAVLIVRVTNSANVVTYEKTNAAWADRAAVHTVYVPIDT